jgi:hypothetical protein
MAAVEQQPLGPRFVYRGPGPGKGCVFTVLEAENDEIVLWGAPLVKSQEIGGWAWLGDKETFKQHFTSVPAAMVPPRPFV